MTKYLNSVFILITLTLVGCSTIAPPKITPSTTPPIESWTKVLDQHVNNKGQVDFITLKDQPSELYNYVDYISKTDPLESKGQFPTSNDRLAHYLNAYNAMAMFAVIESGIPKTNAGLAKVSFFFLKRYQIANKQQSLATYEKGIRELGDPRVHFALNCMSVGCPVLPRIPFRAQSLQDTLEEEAKRFFSDTTKLRVVKSERKVYLSEILKFYQAEFEEKSGSLIAYVNQYIDDKIPEDFEVEFIPYDWTINQS